MWPLIIDDAESSSAQRASAQASDVRPSTAAGLASLREAADAHNGRPASTGNVGAYDGGLGTRQSMPHVGHLQMSVYCLCCSILNLYYVHMHIANLMSHHEWQTMSEAGLGILEV